MKLTPSNNFTSLPKRYAPWTAAETKRDEESTTLKVVTPVVKVFYSQAQKQKYLDPLHKTSTEVEVARVPDIGTLMSFCDERLMTHVRASPFPGPLFYMYRIDDDFMSDVLRGNLAVEKKWVKNTANFGASYIGNLAQHRHHGSSICVNLMEDEDKVRFRNHVILSRHVFALAVHLGRETGTSGQILNATELGWAHSHYELSRSSFIGTQILVPGEGILWYFDAVSNQVVDTEVWLPSVLDFSWLSLWKPTEA